MLIVTPKRFWVLAAAVGLVAGLKARGQDRASSGGPAGAGRMLDEKLAARWKREAAEDPKRGRESLLETTPVPFGSNAMIVIRTRRQFIFIDSADPFSARP